MTAKAWTLLAPALLLWLPLAALAAPRAGDAASQPASATRATVPPGPSANADGARVDTLRPFAAGDVFATATVMNVPDDDHAGTGRILQYDADLNYKGELWVQGTTHQVGGLAFGPDGTLWAMSPQTPAVVEIAPDGRQRPRREWSDRSLSSVTFAPDGTLLFGEHLVGKTTGHPAMTTQFRRLPGRDVIGDGHVFRFTRRGALLQAYPTAAQGGLFGFLGVTSSVLADGGKRLIYLSETGNAIRHYDLADRRQLPDLAVFDQDPAMRRVLIMNARPDGELLVSNGAGFARIDAATGKVNRVYTLPGRGWAAVNSAVDGLSAYVGNYWTGELVRVRLADGAIVARTSVGQKESLSGVAQFPGR